MSGEKFLTHAQVNILPLNLKSKVSGIVTGDRMTKTEATMIRLTKRIVVMSANFLFSNRYTDPCANGKPPNKAPTIYQNLKLTKFHPKRTFILSDKVPNPKVNTPIDHHNR